MKLRTSNLNGFNHVLSNRAFNERLMLTFSLYEHTMPDVWALQEVPTGGKRIILLGDFNKNLNQSEVKELIALGLEDIASVNDNTYFCFGNNNADSVDHILVSQNIAKEVCSVKCNVNVDFVKEQKLSDHAMVDLDLAI